MSAMGVKIDFSKTAHTDYISKHNCTKVNLFDFQVYYSLNNTKSVH